MHNGDGTPQKDESVFKTTRYTKRRVSRTVQYSITFHQDLYITHLYTFHIPPHLNTLPSAAFRWSSTHFTDHLKSCRNAVMRYLAGVWQLRIGKAVEKEEPNVPARTVVTDIYICCCFSCQRDARITHFLVNENHTFILGASVWCWGCPVGRLEHQIREVAE